jgi:hypothetical protein
MAHLRLRIATRFSPSQLSDSLLGRVLHPARVLLVFLLCALFFFFCTHSSAQDIPQGITQWSTQIKAGPVLVDIATGNMVLMIRARSKIGAIPFDFDLIDNVGTEGYLNSNNGFIYSAGMSGLGMPSSTLCGPIGSQHCPASVGNGESVRPLR